jgi:hypothetical protein
MKNSEKASGSQRTIRVRIAVTVDADGNWCAAGANGMSDKEAADATMESEVSGFYQPYFLTIDVPVPRPRPIELGAAVVEAGETAEVS